MSTAPANPAPPLTPAKVGVMLVLTAESMYFAALMASYLVLVAASPIDGNTATSCYKLTVASLLLHVAVTLVVTIVQFARHRPLRTVAMLWIFAAFVAMLIYDMDWTVTP